MKYFSKSDYKNSKLIKRLYSLVLIFSFSFSVITISYKTVHAGLFSLLNTLFTGEQASAKSVPKIAINSQNMSLPVVAVNIDPNPDKNFEAIPVVGETLVTDIAASNATFVEYSPNISVYTVRAGDTISGVAKMFNVSVNTILWANNLSSKSVLKTGQVLTILPVTGIKYTVEKNDTVLDIAKRYHADVDEIYSYNDLDQNSKLFVGQSIIIPDAEIGSVVAVSTRPVVRALNGMIVPEDPVLVNVKGLPSYSGYYSCPAVGVLTQALHGRNAVDIAGPIGTPLRASADGAVTISKSNGTWNGGYGNFVVISHDNGTQTLYGHMQKTIVNAGENVSKGDIIGYIGISGLTTGPHVHFEVRGAKNPFVSISCN
jgi:murein DD-endopeptidase MepM/ murein hydrolase activator NlpD